ncbi:MAG: RNA-guided endonuclease InsQ/TnpB family protein [Candidatus Hodarchaeales archaeon]|jgi:putative transposase
MVLLTWKFGINPTNKQEELLWELSETCRVLYNHALIERRYLYDAYNYSVSYKEQQNALPQLKKHFPRYNIVYSKVLQMTLKKLDGAFQAFFGLRKNGDRTAKLPTFRGKKYFFTLCYNQSGFKITNQTVCFSHKHPSNTELTFSVPFDFTSYQVKQIELFFDRYDNQFYLNVTYEQVEPPFEDNGLYQAFDLGTIKHSAVNLQGKFLESIVRRPDKYWEPKVQSLQRRKDHCKKSSNRHRLFSQRLLTIKRKCNNQTKDWQHKQSKHFVQNTKANTIIVGDLSPKQMVKNGKNKGKGKITKYHNSINRGVHNTGHLSRFIELLTYKAKLLGKKVITIDERNTSKVCSFCGHKKSQIPLHQRIYQCESCGTVLDRDQNSAINIMKRFLSFNALWTSYQCFEKNLQNIGNLRYTANDKTKVSSQRCPKVLIGSADS